MRYIYEINESNEIRVWDKENPNEYNAPFFYQPDWPNETPWADKEEATAWVELFIETLVNPSYEFLPGDSPDEPKKIRPETQGIEEI
jgi:hypothetical protein